MPSGSSSERGPSRPGEGRRAGTQGAAQARPGAAERIDALLQREPIVPLDPPADFLESCAKSGMELEPNELAALGLHLAMLLRVNEEVNLTAVKQPALAWIRHVLDSLTLMPALHEQSVERVVDVGSGGGYPGIVLAIVLPGVRFTLLEATGKKAAFLESAVARLGLSNAEVVNDRAERVGAMGGPLRERFDVAVCRAVGVLPLALELCVPLLRVGGLAVLSKGQRAEQELADAAEASRRLRVEHAGTVATPTGTLLVFEKVARTPRDLPRANGEPARRPLGVQAERSDRRRSMDDGASTADDES